MKIKIAVPYVQYDVYEIEVEENFTDDLDLLEYFLHRREKADLPEPKTYDVKNLQDYMDDTGGIEPFLIEEKDLEELVEHVG